MPKLRVIPGGRAPAAAFNRVVEPHLSALYRSGYRLTRNVADAEDLVQDVCVRAYSRLTELEQMENPRAWLLCIQYRLFVDMTRQRRSASFATSSTCESEDALLEMSSPEPGPEEQADSAFGEARLERAWQYLDRVQQALLALHDIEGYSLAELVEITGITEGTLKSRLHRARVRLGRLLSADSAPRALVARREVKA